MRGMQVVLRGCRWLMLVGVLMCGCASHGPVAGVPESTSSPPPEPILIHLPGIGGELGVDRRLIRGLVAGGVAPKGEIVDWTGEFRGLSALGKTDYNRQQALKLSERLTALYRADPRTPIILTAHSGGAGVAVWALEDLPADVKVQTLLMLAPALSPGYDLSRALAHTRRAFSFYSEYDNLVLGAGTRAFGTIDRVTTNAAGYVGFIVPPDSDPHQYAKLTQFPYDPAWTKLGNYGDHIGATDSQFAKEFLAPMLRQK